MNVTYTVNCLLRSAEKAKVVERRDRTWLMKIIKLVRDQLQHG